MITIDALLIILTGAVVAGSCALLGSFLVLRKMSMLGDAISHAVLPGIVIAFLITNSRGSLIMFVGAVVFGLLTTFLVQFLSSKGVQGDAAIGVAFTFLFAVGVVLISLYGQHVDLDLDCVLYGEIAYTPFDQLIVGGQSFGPRPLWINAVLLIINFGLVLLFYKQFKITSFDPAMATAVGINVTAFHYLLMLQVSVTTVGAFESVGAILVVAMLIVPASAAYLMTEKLHRMLIYAVGIGVASAIFGYYAAVFLDASIAGSIATVSGIFFILAYLFSPSQGVVSKQIERWKLRTRIAREDALLWLWRNRETEAVAVTSANLAATESWPAQKALSILSKLTAEKLVDKKDERYQLTYKGESEALALIRRHRLFESYLGEYGDYDSDHLHPAAHRAEHFIDSETTERMERVVKDTREDPHGKPIP